MRPYRRWTLVLFAASLLASALWAREIPSAPPEAVGMSSAKLRDMQAAAEKMVDEGMIAGIVTAVARQGTLVHLSAYGQRDIDGGKAMEKDTIVRIYSMSKPITSVAAMMLYDAGKLKLDEPATTYIPELRGLKVYGRDAEGRPEYAQLDRPVIVRDLLRHTSGFTYGVFGDTPVDRMYRQNGILGNKDLKDMIERLAEIPLQYQPGTKWHYSVSTDVLGHLIERVSGQPLDVFFQEHIFTPLDMNDTGFYVPQAKHDRFSQCYGPDPNGGLRVISQFGARGYLRPRTFLSGGGGLVSTARDYLRFCQMLLNDGQLDGVRILKADTVAMMTGNQLPPGVSRSDGAGFGLGFSVQLASDPSGAARVGEYGWGGAASTFFKISPKDETVFVILTQYMPYAGRIENALKPMVYAAFLDEG